MYYLFPVGYIPVSLTTLSKLRYLGLDHNAFSGKNSSIYLVVSVFYSVFVYLLL